MSRDACCAADAFHIMTGEIWSTYWETSKNGTLWNTIEMGCHQSQQWNSYYVVMQDLNQFHQSWARRFSNPRCGESSFTWVFTVCLFVSMVIRPRLLLPVTPVCSDEQRTQWVIETNELLQLLPIKSKLEGQLLVRVKRLWSLKQSLSTASHVGAGTKVESSLIFWEFCQRDSRWPEGLGKVSARTYGEHKGFRARGTVVGQRAELPGWTLLRRRCC